MRLLVQAHLALLVAGDWHFAVGTRRNPRCRLRLVPGGAARACLDAVARVPVVRRLPRCPWSC